MKNLKIIVSGDLLIILYKYLPFKIFLSSSKFIKLSIPNISPSPKIIKSSFSSMFNAQLPLKIINILLAISSLVIIICPVNGNNFTIFLIFLLYVLISNVLNIWKLSVNAFSILSLVLIILSFKQEINNSLGINNNIVFSSLAKAVFLYCTSLIISSPKKVPGGIRDLL